MRIHIEAFRFDVIIGLLDFERTTAQEVIVDLEATYTYQEGVFINYADISSDIQTHLTQKSYHLLEDALLGLKEVLILKYPQIESLSLKITKPNILPRCSVALSEIWDFSQ